MKELLRKKSVRISILLIILLVVMGIVGINVRSAQRSKEYDEHIAAAEKYLTELDYEQAIAEYTAAFEIDPKEEVVDALEQTYLAYAQTCMDTGNYDKAVSILEEGYAKTGRESIQAKTAEFRVIQEEIQAKEAEIQEQKRLEEEKRRLEEEQRARGMIEFPFQMTDITIRGYDLSGDYYTQLKELYLAEAVENVGYGSDEGYSWMGFHISDDGYCEITERDANNYEYDVRMSNCIGISGRNGYANYVVDYESDSSEASLTLVGNYRKDVYSYEGINVPVKPGETYEDWCRVMQVNQIKENNLRPEERDGKIGIWNEDVCVICEAMIDNGGSDEHWIFSTEWYQGIYSEYYTGDEHRNCRFCFSKPSIDGVREEWPIEFIYARIAPDGVIDTIYYYGWPIAQ